MKRDYQDLVAPLDDVAAALAYRPPERVFAPLDDVDAMDTEAGGSGLPFGSEQELAERFIASAAGQYRWSPGMDWLANRGTHWERDALHGRDNLAKEVCRQAAAEADTPRLAMRICSAAAVSAMIGLSRSSPAIATPVARWDADPMILNTPGDAIDLATGRAVPRDGMLFTQVTSVAPKAVKTPLWDKFLSEVFPGDVQMIEFMQRLMGYSLTGSIREQKLFFLHGTGANGKSVFLDVLHALGGTYAYNLPAEALMSSRNSGHPTMLASLRGKRCAISSEIEEGAHWSEARIKALTGDETLTARFMRQDFFEFKLTSKHIIAGNYKPRMRGDDFAMVRRLVLVPFAQRFEGARRDNHLTAKLKTELPGILAWAIAGAVKWAAGGLAIPQHVADASQQYCAEQNDLELWLDECCEREDKVDTGAAMLYESFRRWKESSGERAPSNKSFSQRLERIFNRTRTRTGSQFKGLRLKAGGGLFGQQSNANEN